MEMLALAIKSGLPLIYVKTEDLINIGMVLSHIAGEEVKPMAVKTVIDKVSDLKVPAERVFYASNDCQTMAKLYHFCADNDKTIIFVNTEKSVLHFDGGILVPPKELVLEYLSEFAENPEELSPAFGGLTLKDIGEIAKMTMTRDSSLTVRGINETRRGYNKLRGISQVDTALSYYMVPSYLDTWMQQNTKFFTEGKHAALTPRGLLFDGPPGTGKTLASKYIASEFGVPLYRLDVGAMMHRYVGSSEENLTAALAQVDQVEPAVIIFDEIEKVFQSSGDSGVTSRLLSQLLWWMAEHQSRVFTVMTTNDVSKIPEELYREGRIDAVMQFLGVEDYPLGIEFAKGAFAATMGEMQIPVTAEYTSRLQKKVKALFNDGEPVPQSKLTQEVYSLVRVISVEEAS